MKKIFQNPKLLLLVAATVIIIPLLWLLGVGLSLPDGESFQIVQKTPLNSLEKAGQALIITPALLLLDIILSATALFFIYTMAVNIPQLLKKEIEFPWFIQVVLVASLSSAFTFYAVKETPRILFDFTGINVPFHRVILSSERELHLVHEIIGVRKSFYDTSLTAIHGECIRTDRLDKRSYLVEFIFQVGLEIGPSIYLTREKEPLQGRNPQYGAYLEMSRLARATGARLDLKRCPHIEEIPPGLYPSEPITGKEPWIPPR